MSKRIVDIPASIRARLLALARGAGTEFQSVLVRYALERLMYRLSISASSLFHVGKLNVSCPAMR